MSQRPAMSRAETQIARTVWELGEATVRQVFEQAGADRVLDFKTVQTYLRRLESKGYLTAKKCGRAKVYSPKVRPRQAVREAVDDFVDRLFNGETLSLVHHLVCERGINAADISKLRKMLRQLEARRDGD